MATAAPTPATRAPEVGAVTPTPQAERPPAPRWGVAALGLLATAALAVAVFGSQDTRQGVLLATGLALGVTLYHSRFGFTSAWRRLVSVGQGDGLRAHLLMLAVASAIFAPILSAGAGLFDQSAVGSVAPVGLSVVAGAFLFGVGMQLGGACASGTLYTIGGGQTAILITLAAFIAGSVLGAWNWTFWTETLPSFGPVSLATDTGLGYGGALAVQLAAFAAIAAVTVAVARRRRPPAPAAPPSARGPARFLRGTWPLWVGALVLAGLNGLTLLMRGEPWGITSAFALWGSKLLQGLGVDVASWSYWQGEKAQALQGPLLADVTTVMNVGIVLGALVAAAVAGTFTLHRRIPGRTVAAAVIGGLLMGYGARLAYGCNIGAYFGGIASFSLHGWLWGAMALGGTWLGLKLRPRFALAVPRRTDSSC
jgi:uncharacterized protein